MGRPKSRLSKIYGAIKKERQRQDGEHGSLSTHGHSIPEWILIMRAQLDQAEKIWVNGYVNGSLAEINLKAAVLKATATGFACLEEHGTVVKVDDSWKILD